MIRPPMPKPIISSEYGIAASARATPNSACTAGSVTGTTYMPQAPTVISASVTTRRAAAYGYRSSRQVSGAACKGVTRSALDLSHIASVLGERDSSS